MPGPTLEACIEDELEAVQAGRLQADDIVWIEYYMLTGSRTQAERQYLGLTRATALGENERQRSVTRFRRCWPYIAARLRSTSEMVHASKEEVTAFLTMMMREADAEQTRLRAAVAMAKINGQLTNVVQLEAGEDTIRFLEEMRSARFGSKSDEGGS
jgi:hypothetical protein